VKIITEVRQKDYLLYLLLIKRFKANYHSEQSIPWPIPSRSHCYRSQRISFDTIYNYFHRDIFISLKHTSRNVQLHEPRKSYIRITFTKATIASVSISNNLFPFILIMKSTSHFKPHFSAGLRLLISTTLKPKLSFWIPGGGVFPIASSLLFKFSEDRKIVVDFWGLAVSVRNLLICVIFGGKSKEI